MFTLRNIKELLSKRPKISKDTAILTSKIVTEALRKEKAKVAIVARVGIHEKNYLKMLNIRMLPSGLGRKKITTISYNFILPAKRIN